MEEAPECDAAIFFVLELNAGRFEQAAQPFDSAMRSVMPVDALRETWQQLVGQVGPYQGTHGCRVEPRGAYRAAIATVLFERTALDITVVLDSTRRIGGLWFTPAKGVGEWQPPEYVHPETFSTREITFGLRGWELPGTFYEPVSADLSHAILLVHGSGPNDRNETLGPSKPFADIAQGLASHGFAVLAYDKRTLIHGGRFAEKKQFTVDDETVDDAVTGVAHLKDSLGAKKVYVVGHSLGAIMAPRIAVRSGRVDGIIMLAPAGRPIEDLILDQFTYLDSLGQAGGVELDDVRAQVALVKSDVLSPNTPDSALPLGLPASYWLDLRGYDPVAVADSLRQAGMLVRAYFGGRDYQVIREDYDVWHRAFVGDAVLYENLNHLFMAGEGMSTPAEYQQAGHVDYELIRSIYKNVVAR